MATSATIVGSSEQVEAHHLEKCHGDLWTSGQMFNMDHCLVSVYIVGGASLVAQ